MRWRRGGRAVLATLGTTFGTRAAWRNRLIDTVHAKMINRPLFKCLLAALSVLSRVGGTRSWIAPLRDPLLRHWIVPVRNVSVHVA